MEGKEAAAREVCWGAWPLSHGHEEEDGSTGDEGPAARGDGSLGAAGRNPL